MVGVKHEINGAFATAYFILFNNHVAGTITAQGRDLTKTMDRVNEDYWYNQWHLDFELHEKVGITDVTPIDKNEPVSIYADTDSLFVSFKPAIDHCNWENLVLNDIDTIDKRFIVLTKHKVKTNNKNCVGVVHSVDELKDTICNSYDLLIFDGHFIKDRNLNKLIKDGVFTSEIKWNWTSELDLIQGLDYYRHQG